MSLFIIALLFHLYPYLPSQLSLCKLHQDYGHLHKHFTDKDGQLFTDEAKVLLAAATKCVYSCTSGCVWCVCEKERERGKERMTKTAPNVRPLSVWTPTGLSAGTHLSNALNADSNLGLYCKSEHYGVYSCRNK